MRTGGAWTFLSGVADRVAAYYMNTATGRAELPDAMRGRAALYDLRAAVADTAGDGTGVDRYLEQGLELLLVAIARGLPRARRLVRRRGVALPPRPAQ